MKPPYRCATVSGRVACRLGASGSVLLAAAVLTLMIAVATERLKEIERRVAVKQVELNETQRPLVVRQWVA